MTRDTFWRLATALLLLIAASDLRAQSPTVKTDYVLRAGDIIRVSVLQSPELTLETRIPETGVVNYPLMGPVTLGGLTISQAEKAIADGLLLGKFLKQPAGVDSRHPASGKSGVGSRACSSSWPLHPRIDQYAPV